jgi:16S rRNA C967 or C1407 C5-methylase (RsmB/RsmF family)/NOL1/NOP2/fmu family ribosome biogenesis protein
MTPDQFPQAFTKRLQTQLGDQWNEFVSAHQQPPPVSIRINPEKGDISDPREPVPWCRFGHYLSERPSFTLDPAFHGGKYYVQEASSMFLEQLFTQIMGTSPALNVLDLSAAPGGKSTHLLSLMSKDSLLVSNEVIQSRASVLSENLQKWGGANVVITNSDPRQFSRLPGFFDVIVVDAPCSGEGLFRKDPLAVAEWSEDNIALCCKRQRRILSDVWPALKSGGVLLYSTCTYNEMENEDNLRWLAEQSGADGVSIHVDERWGVETVQHQHITGYRFYPHRVKGEGFFIAALRKTADQDEGRIKKGSYMPAPKKVKEQLAPWTLNPEDKFFVERNGLVHFFPQEKMDAVNQVVSELYTVSAGTTMASIKHNKMVPEHALALSSDLNRAAFPELSLDRDNALAYLRKDHFEAVNTKRGFALVSFEGTGLGWANVLDNRINNLYPSQWRIRMR